MLDDIEMPRVLRRLSQMTNTVQKTTELILFGPLPSAYTLSSSKEEQENAEAETEADDTTIAHDSKLFPPTVFYMDCIYQQKFLRKPKLSLH